MRYEATENLSCFLFELFKFCEFFNSLSVVDESEIANNVDFVVVRDRLAVLLDGVNVVLRERDRSS